MTARTGTGDAATDDGAVATGPDGSPATTETGTGDESENASTSTERGRR